MPSRNLSKERRSSCPVACALDLIGDRWTLLVVRDLFLGKKRFEEFLTSPESIATNILSDRLQWLVGHGLAERSHDPEDGRRILYCLTAKGRSLKKILKAVADWGHSSIPGTIDPSTVLKEAGKTRR